MPQQVRVVSLRDLARAPVRVPVSLGEIEVRGLSGHAMMRIYERFPDFDQLSEDPNNTQTRKTMMQLLPVVIVEGVGLHEDPEAYGLAENLGFDDQLKLFEAIMRVTNPPGGAGKSSPLDEGAPANHSHPADTSSLPAPQSALAAAPAEDAKAPVITSL